MKYLYLVEQHSVGPDGTLCCEHLLVPIGSKLLPNTPEEVQLPSRSILDHPAFQLAVLLAAFVLLISARG